ncbi:MAG: DUF2029 domain-containing protein, partial [Chloroflexi bacterium]
APPPRPQPQPAPLLTRAPDFWLILALFVAFRLLTLFLLRPGGYIRDWSDFDTYFGIAALSDYGLYPFVHFWLEWPPLVPWLAVGAYRLTLNIAPWADDARLWFILLMGGVFLLFEVGNFVLLSRLARRLFSEPRTVTRVLWLYAGLFPPVYAMLGFFDGVALFFILLALDLLLQERRSLSAAAVGVGVMVKVIPGLMLPVAARRLWYLHRKNNRDAGIEVGLYVVIAGLAVFVLLLPFLLLGPEWVLAFFRAVSGRASWETVWAVIEGYYGFGVVLGDRLNPAETSFAVHPGGLPWGLVTLAFALLYAVLFTRNADYSRPKNVAAFAGLTTVLLLLYNKGYSPQFLVYLLPFVILLMPNGRGLTYALILTGLNVLEQPVYFVILPDAHWLLTFVVISRAVILLLLGVEFGLMLWPLPERQSIAGQLHRLAPAVLGGAAALALLLLIPVTVWAYNTRQLESSPLGAFAQFMNLQASSAETPPRLLLSDQSTYRQVYPQLRGAFDLQLTDGPQKGFTGAPATADLLKNQSEVWILPTGPQGQALLNTVASRGTALGVYNFEGLGEVSHYSFAANPLPDIPLARFIGGIELLDYSVTVQPDAVNLTLFWRTQTPQNQNLTVFTQLLNSEGNQVAGQDSVPRHGTAPVTGWTTGTVQIDPHTIQLPANLPPGDYTLIVGLYNDSTERVRGIDPDGFGFANRAVPLEVLRF